jgi:hypothetical protein
MWTSNDESTSASHVEIEIMNLYRLIDESYDHEKETRAKLRKRKPPIMMIRTAPTTIISDGKRLRPG